MKTFNQTEVKEILGNCIAAGMDKSKMLDYFGSDMSQTPEEFTKDINNLNEDDYLKMFNGEGEGDHSIPLVDEKGKPVNNDNL
ncbi:MAG: hypothetical protein ACOYXB_00585 [Bacteroidota bacterium]